MAESAKFTTKDLAKEITRVASPAKIKLDNDKMELEVFIFADDLKSELKGKEWDTFEKSLEKEFNDNVKEMIRSLGSKMKKADEQMEKCPSSLYSEMLRPLCGLFEKKFEEHATRIHSVMERELKEACRSHKVSKVGKVRVDLEYANFELTGKRSIGSSSSSAPVVKIREAGKDVTATVESTIQLPKKLDAYLIEFRANLRKAKPDNVEAIRAACAKIPDEYKKEGEALEKSVKELLDALEEEQKNQLEWRKKYLASKPNYTPDQQNVIKKNLTQILTELDTLVKEAKKSYDSVDKGVKLTIELMENGLKALEGELKINVIGPAAVALGAQSFQAERDLGPFLRDVKDSQARLQKQLRLLAKAATPPK